MFSESFFKNLKSADPTGICVHILGNYINIPPLGQQLETLLVSSLSGAKSLRTGKGLAGNTRHGVNLN